MRQSRWQLKRLCLGLSAALLLFVICSSGYNKYIIKGLIPDAKPAEVWSYVADFSKMRLLNPSILDFKVVADAGNTHDWRYTVVYTERLGHWPYWLNTITAHFQVTQSMPGVQPVSYGILSQHNTCFFKGLYCLHAESQFKFNAVDKGTHCEEHIQYQCPLFLGLACRRELESQRQAVMQNLTHIFSKKTIK